MHISWILKSTISDFFFPCIWTSLRLREWCAAFRERQFFTSDLQPFNLTSALRKQSFWFHAVVRLLETIGLNILFSDVFALTWAYYSVFSFFTIFFFSPSRGKKTKTFRQMIFDSWFLFFIIPMFSSERRQQWRKYAFAYAFQIIQLSFCFLIATMPLELFSQRVGDEWQHIDDLPCPPVIRRFVQATHIWTEWAIFKV